MQVEYGKKELVFTKEVDTMRLMSELYEFIPALKPTVFEDGSFDVNLRVFTNGSKLILWVLNEVSNELVQQVVNEHEFPIIEPTIDNEEIIGSDE